MAPTTDTPFPGPRPFSLSDKECFFGRAKETRDLMDLILAYPVVVLSAQSGAGKTSLINAGLADKAPKENVQILLTRVSGRIPADRIAAIDNVFAYNCLCGLRAIDGKAPRTSPRDLERLPLLAAIMALLGDLNLVEASSTAALCRPTIIVIDQFEEIFSSHQERWKDRRSFFEQLTLVLTALPDLHVLLAIRDDYVSTMDPFAPLLPGSLRIRYRLERLRREQALDAIKKPMAIPKHDCLLRSGIAEAAVSDLLKTNVVRTPGAPDAGPVEGEYVEPVHLQVVCSNLWSAMADATPLSPEMVAKLTTDETLAQNAEALIFTRGHQWFRGEAARVSDVDRILCTMYDRAVLRCARHVKGGEKHLRRFLGEDLITVGGTRGLIDVATAESRGVSVSALKLLEDARILRREPRAGAEWYELTHDRFIRPVRESNEAWRKRTLVPQWLRRLVAGILLLLTVVLGGALQSARNRTWKTEENARKAEEDAKKAQVALGRKLEDAEANAKKAEAQRALMDAKDVAEESREQFLLRQAIFNVKNVEDLNNLKTAFAQDAVGAPLSTGGDSEARNKARRFWNQGYERSVAGSPQLAARYYRRALEADPTYAPAYNSLGIIEHNSLRLDEASRLYGEAISHDPKYLPAYMNLAGLELMRNNPAKARELAERALEVRPNYKPARRMVANAEALTPPR